MICDYRKSTFQYLDIFNITFHSAVHQSGQGVLPETAGAPAGLRLPGGGEGDGGQPPVQRRSGGNQGLHREEKTSVLSLSGQNIGDK